MQDANVSGSSPEVTVQIHGKDAHVYAGRVITQIDVECAIGSKVFRDWVVALDPMIPVSNVTIQGIYYRSKTPSPDKVLFIMLVAEIPGAYPYSIVLRGPTVVVLPVFVCDDLEYTVGVQQRRPAVGSRYFPETIAGMTDGGDVVAKALDELREETEGDGEPGIKIRQSDLCQLGVPLEPSPGIMSEPMHFFYARIPTTRAALDRFEGRMTGAADENEEIVLKVMPLDHLPLWAPRDMKAEIAYRRYRDLFPKQRP